MTWCQLLEIETPTCHAITSDSIKQIDRGKWTLDNVLTNFYLCFELKYICDFSILAR